MKNWAQVWNKITKIVELSQRAAVEIYVDLLHVYSLKKYFFKKICIIAEIFLQ